MTTTSLKLVIGLVLAAAVTAAYGLQEYAPRAAKTAEPTRGEAATPAATDAALPTWARLIGRGIGIGLVPGETESPREEQ